VQSGVIHLQSEVIHLQSEVIHLQSEVIQLQSGGLHLQSKTSYLAASAVLPPYCKCLGQLDPLHSCKGGCCLHPLTLLHLNSRLQPELAVSKPFKCSKLLTLSLTQMTVSKEMQAEGS